MQILRKLFICLALSLVVAGARPAAAQSYKWWQSENFQTGLSMSQEQIDRIEAIYQAALPQLRAQKSALDNLERILSKVIADSTSDEAAVLQAAERMEAARAEMSRTRTLQLFRIRRVLTDDQNAKLKEMHDHDRRERERERERKPKDELSHD